MKIFCHKERIYTYSYTMYVSYQATDLSVVLCQVLPPSLKESNYGLRATRSGSHLTKFLVNNIHIYDFKLIYYKNTFHN